MTWRLHTVAKQKERKMPNEIQESVLDATTEQVSRLAIEYGQLSALPELNDRQEKRMQEILDLACEDGALSFWISELDHVLGHELGLLSPDYRRDYNNQKALLREYMLEFLEADFDTKEAHEKREFLEKYLESKRNPETTDPLLLSKRPQANRFTYSEPSSRWEIVQRFWERKQVIVRLTPYCCKWLLLAFCFVSFSIHFERWNHELKYDLSNW